MKASTISQINAREILDSRGNPTVETEVLLDDGSSGSACVPSGASTGSKEALEMRDGGERYLGKGVQKAIANIQNTLAPRLTGFSTQDFLAIDQVMLDLDASPTKSNLGANAILSISMACARAIAASNGVHLFSYINLLIDSPKSYLPTPMMNVINGGTHADNSLDIQEFMIQPIGAPNIFEAIRCGAEIFHHLKNLLKKQNLITAVGDEGGFAPDLPNTSAALELLSEATSNAGYNLGKDITFALDCAASELYKNNEYHIEGKKLDSYAMVDFLANLCKDYPIASIEDGLDENDYEGWKYLTKKIGAQVQLVGDDVFVTNSSLLKQGIQNNIANAILIKLNQIGSLSETLDCIATAHKNGYHTIISHRSGETEDTFIADLSVGSGSSQIKTGSLCRSERVAKYNQLIRIALAMPSLDYAGRNFLRKEFIF